MLKKWSFFCMGVEIHPVLELQLWKLCCLRVLLHLAFQASGLKCCSRALLTDGCSWRRSFSRTWKKMLRPKRAWTLDPQVTVNSPVGLNDSTWHENDTTWKHNRMLKTMIGWKGNRVTSIVLRRKWTGGTEFNGVERRRERWKESWGESRRCAQKWESLKRDDERWEVVGRVDKWFHNLRQEVRSPGKEHGSLPQLL